MWKPALAMLAGVLLLLSLPALPPLSLVAGVIFAFLALLLLWRKHGWLWLLPLGFAWCYGFAQQQLTMRLDPGQEGRELVVSGWIHSIPEDRGEFSSFEFSVETLDTRRPGDGVPKLLRLGWTAPAVLPRPGEHWRLQVRLHRPRGYMDPGGFDYEGWLFRKGIGATGYVMDEGSARLDGNLRFPLLRARFALMKRIRQALAGDEFGGMAAALATGDQSAISREQWQVLADTNTVHLMAIAGLHIGVVAGLFYVLCMFLWRRSCWLCERVPVKVAGGVAALTVAMVYAAMAGFPLPTQRALLMLAAATVGLLLRRRLRAADVLGLALMGMLLLDPLSAGEAGFWLSFGAVAAILYAFDGRLGMSHGWLLELARTQWALGIGLLPLLAFFFHRAGMTAPLANLAVVPVFCFLVLPLLLTGVLGLFIWPALGGVLLKTATAVMALCWPLLDRLAHLPSALWPSPLFSYTALLTALLGAAWVLMPRGVPARWLGAVLMLPVFLAPPSGIATGGFELTLLDVGQGLSAVVRTAEHSLVYDTGPGFYDGADAGQEVVVPYLQSVGVSEPDLTVMSHGDRDHAGGLASLRTAYPGMPVLAGDEDRFTDVEPCTRGRHWDWDGVHFETLSPDTETPHTGNNGSCVLKISGAGGSLLLTGDIMHKTEQRLMALDPAVLRSDVLVAPHHGSNSSSGADFISAVAPAQVLFPVGYRNHWGFPRPEVVARYQAAGAVMADTAADGAIRIEFRPGMAPALVLRYRLDAARLWTEH